VTELFVDASRTILLFSKSSHRTLQESSGFCRTYFGKCSAMRDECAGYRYYDVRHVTRLEYETCYMAVASEVTNP
jgi:hypothetical protein